MKLFMKGFIIGLGKIIPGVSGSVIAIRLNVYEKMIDALNSLFKHFKENSSFLIKLGSGIILAILCGSHVLLSLLNLFPHFLPFLFFLLIATGIPTIWKETHNYLFAFFSFIIYLFIFYFPNLNIAHNYFLMGFLEAITTIIPGISGTALFMSLGMYDELLSFFAHLSFLQIDKLLPFSLGLFLGALILIRFINYCFKKYHSQTYGVILGFLLGSMLIMIIKR